jgi:transposase
MEQRAVVRFYTLKGVKSKKICMKLTAVYGTESLALATVKKWRLRFSQGRRDLFDDPRSGRPLTHDLSQAISSMLEERPFSSCKMLCRHFRIGKAMCLRILHDSLGLKKLHLRWVPHTLSANQKSERVTYSRLLAKALEKEQPNKFQRVITGDESWFFLYYPHDSACAASRDLLPERTSQ